MAISPKKRVTKKASKSFSFDINKLVQKITFSGSDQQAFLEDLATLVDDGVPANRAIELLGNIEKGAKKKVAEQISLKVAQGRGIADGMEDAFTPAVVELVRAGEEGGTLAQNIRLSAESLGTRSDTLASLAASMTYPLVVLIAGCIVLVYIDNKVFPQFAAIKPISEWPSDGQNLVALAEFLKSYWHILIGVIIAFTIGITFMMRNFKGELRTSLDKVYGMSIYRQLMAARFMETLGLLIANGVVFKKALAILQRQASPYLMWHMRIMENKLGRGRGNIAEVLDTGLISNEDILRLKAIAAAKGFEHALIRLGKAASTRAIETIRKVGRIGGGVFLALSGAFAGYMVMGLYSVGSSLS